MGKLAGSAGYGQGEHEISAAELDRLDAAGAVRRRIADSFASGSYKPPMLPQVALEVHELAQDPDVEPKRIAALLQRDTVLAGLLLRKAQSPLYAMPGASVSSLQGAITMLGLRALSELVWDVALGARVFRSPVYGPQMEELQRHSTATAYFARLVAAYGPAPRDFAFLAGLLHDIGIAATFLVAGEQIRPAPDPELIAMATRSEHEETSALIARLWKLPPALEAVLQVHHRLTVGGQVNTVAAVVAVAEHFSTRYGASLPSIDPPPVDRDLEVAKKALGINDVSWKKLETEAATLAKGLGLLE